MYVSGVELVGIVLGPTVIQKKTFTPEFITATQAVIQCIVCVAAAGSFLALNCFERFRTSDKLL